MTLTNALLSQIHNSETKIPKCFKGFRKYINKKHFCLNFFFVCVFTWEVLEKTTTAFPNPTIFIFMWSTEHSNNVRKQPAVNYPSFTRHAILARIWWFCCIIKYRGFPGLFFWGPFTESITNQNIIYIFFQFKTYCYQSSVHKFF